jgi:hypothetical protein
MALIRSSLISRHGAPSKFSRVPMTWFSEQVNGKRDDITE